ncbi:MAG: hypothetical protein ABI120_01650, partial [Gemmatimonadaceae bacterium]
MELCIAPDPVTADDLSVSSSNLLSLEMVVAAPDEQVARELTNMLASQRWPAVCVMFPVTDAVRQARAS